MSDYSHLGSSISANDLRRLQSSDPELLVLDVRREADYAASETTLPNSVRWDIAGQASTPPAVRHAITRGNLIVAFCLRGDAQSLSAVRRLGNSGAQAVSLEGGYRAWSSQGLELAHKVGRTNT